jgi:hypothetical protein
MRSEKRVGHFDQEEILRAFAVGFSFPIMFAVAGRCPQPYSPIYQHSVQSISLLHATVCGIGIDESLAFYAHPSRAT